MSITISSFWNWLITSSADPQKTSLFVKGVLVVLGAQVLHALEFACGVGLYCAGIDQMWINQIIDSIVNLVFILATLGGAISGLIGLIRKAIKGQWSAAYIDL